MEKLIRDMLVKLGEDPKREGLLRTPARVAESLAYLTHGYTLNLKEIVNDAIYETDTNHMVIVKDIEIFSMCEHHMLPFYGKAHIGYIPHGKVIGVSKLARIADMFARRLQIQERLTHQVARTLMDQLNPEGVGVVIEAKHLCMMMRGVEKQNSSMVTSAMLGSFHNSAATRNEFLKLIARSELRGY